METPITSRDLSDMVRHWLACPVNGYLGAGYGCEVKSLLQTPMSAGLADDLISKAREDVPLLSRTAAGALNVYAYDRDFETKVIAFEIGGQLIDIGAVA